MTLIPQNFLFRHRNSTKASSQPPVLELPGTLVEKVSRENSQYSLEALSLDTHTHARISQFGGFETQRRAVQTTNYTGRVSDSG